MRGQGKKVKQEGDQKTSEMDADPTPSDGLRRSRRLQNLAPLPMAGGNSGNSSSQSSAPEEEEATHPCLLNEDILDGIFKHLIHQSRSTVAVVKDAKNFRLVCKPWRNSATRIYRRIRQAPTTFSHFSQAQSTSNANRGPPPTSSNTFTGFIYTMRASDMIPVQRYNICYSVLGKGNDAIFAEFFRICGPEVVSLGIPIHPTEADSLMKNLATLSPEWSMVKLQTLKLNMYDDLHCHPGTPVKPEVVVDLFGFLLTAAPTLRELELAYYYSDGSYRPQPSNEVISLLNLLGQQLAVGIPRTVKKLSLSMHVGESTISNLAESGLKLESLELRLPSLLGSGPFRNFLRGQADTLKELTVKAHFGNHGEGLSVEFPPLHELVEMELANVVVSFGAKSNFAKSFPKLGCLNIQWMDSDNALQALLSSVQTSPPMALKILHLPGFNCTSLAPNIEKIAKSFPSIVELCVMSHHGTKETLEEIFKYFAGIQSLDIVLSNPGRVDYNADSVFSGINISAFPRIRRLLQRDGNVSLTGYHRGPSLLNLTNLRKLVVHNCFENDSIVLTDIFAELVLLKMPKLVEVRLSGGIQRFSPRYDRLLRDKLVQ